MADRWQYFNGVVAGVALLCLICVGCLTAPGRAVRSGANTLLSLRLERYCAARTEAERQLIRDRINAGLHFSGQIIIVCPAEQPVPDIEGL